MNDRLRGALAEIAERAPVIDTPDSLWTTGRRSHRRSGLASAVAVIAVLISTAGLGLSVRSESRPAPVAPPSGAPGVPSRLYAVPGRLVGADDRGVPTAAAVHDLAMGRASAAYLTAHGLPVVVTAGDGQPRLVALPGFVGPSSSASLLGAGFALSPDGRYLAYGFAIGFDRWGTPSVTGVRVLRLSTGSIRTIALPRVAQGTQVRLVTWSPDGKWLAWYGQQAVKWNSSGETFQGELRGRIAPGSTSSDPLPSPDRADLAMAIDDTGRVALMTHDRLRLVAVDGPVSSEAIVYPGARVLGNPPQLAFDPSGQSLAVAATAPAIGTYVLALQGLTFRRALLPKLGPDGATIDPIAWLPSSQGRVSVAEVHGIDGDTVLPGRLVLTRWLRGRGAATVVGDVDGPVAAPVSVATDLMTVDQPTHTYPAPHWPPAPGSRLVPVCLGITTALGLIWLVIAGVARRRRSAGAG